MAEHPGGWTVDELERIAAVDVLHIAVRGADGTLGREVPIWAVRVDGDVYVRAWYRRGTGWCGRVLRSRRARIRVPGVEADVVVGDVGTDHRTAVDDAYRAAYGRYGAAALDRMIGDAAATTLRLRADGTTP